MNDSRISRSITREPIHWIAWISVAALSLVVFLGKSYETSLPPNDSALHALIALSETGSGLLPKLPMPYNGGFNDHPFTMFYLNGWVMRLFEASAWSARLLPALLGVGCVLLTGVIGTVLHSQIFGFVSALLLLLTPGFILAGASFGLDVPMTFFMLLSFYFWITDRFLLAGLIAGLGMWVKTPVALLILPVSFLYSLQRKRFLKDAKSLMAMGMLAFVTVALFWGFVFFVGGWEVVRDYWMRQVFGTAVGGRGGAQIPDPFLFFKFITYHRDHMPWIIVLVSALIMVIQRRKWKENAFVIPFLAILVLVMAISPMRFKYSYYFLPTLPFLALIKTYLFETKLCSWSKQIYEGITAISLFVMAVLLASPISFAPEAFPALKKFNAMIQSSGSCIDNVLYVEGGEPYGNFLDYRIEIEFYTGRKVRQASCSELEKMALEERSAWIILAGENFKKCVTPEIRTLFPVVFKFGNQYLFSKNLSINGALDLTPLDRELRASIDCKRPPLIRDGYHRYD